MAPNINARFFKTGYNWWAKHYVSTKTDEWPSSGLSSCPTSTIAPWCALWHFCGATNTKKLERIQFRALRFVFLDFESDYETLLDRAGLPTLELSRKMAILNDVYKNLTHQSPAFLWNSYKPMLINYSLRNTLQ